jgi:WD40 repeat protein
LEWNTGLQTLNGHGDTVLSVAFSHDSKQVVSASSDRTVKIWDSAMGQCLQTLNGHGDAVRSVAFSHDSKQVVSASSDHTVKIWDSATGQCLQTLNGHGDTVRSVAFSHDSKQVVSASSDHTVKIWDSATGQCFQTVDIGRTLYIISFDITSQHLYTEIGVINLNLAALSASNTALTIAAPQKPRCQGYGVSSDGVWITWNSENLLWLPPGYRPWTSAVAGSTVAIGCGSGQVLIFKFL